MPKFRRTDTLLPPDLSINPSRPKLYTVNLDTPPRQRYASIAADFKEHMRELTPLFAQVVNELGLPTFTPKLAKYVLKRVWDREEQEEILGLVEGTGIELYLVVAFNSFLDVLMGCTSGAVKLGKSSGAEDGMREEGMVHFRTLDWEMEKLREVIIEVEYMRTGRVVARALTYAGYIGVLTGVRPGLSISLNFRETISPSTPTWQLYLQQLLVLLGYRQSISSILRHMLLAPPPSSSSSSSGSLPTMADILRDFPTTKSAPCYITLCDGHTAAYIEKDIHTAKVYTSNTFISCTNHDQMMEEVDLNATIPDKETREDIEESIERKMNVRNLYEKIVPAGPPASPSPHQHDAEFEQEHKQEEQGSLRRSARLKQKKEEKKKSEQAQCERVDGGGVAVEDVCRWLETYPTWNECTHLACVMDPRKGEMVWARSYSVE